MRILVTGGTGFVGSHAVRELVARGHEVRVLARRPEAVTGVEAVPGDVTDPAAVRRALVGCDAILHSGSVFSFDARDAARIRATNVVGTEIVLGAARDAGCDPIVHMSSTLALVPVTGPLTADSPPGDSGYPYTASKADSERVARRLQGEGAPVVSVYAGWVWGPDDPRRGESFQVARDLLRGTMRLVPPGRSTIVDVRDLATLLATVFVQGRGPRRYVAAGTPVTFPELATALGEAAGRRIPVHVVPGPVALFGGSLADGLRRFGPRLPANREGTWVYLNGPAVDDRATWAELGIVRRPLATTLADVVRWMGASA